MSAKYLHGRYLPDKAIDVLDGRYAAARLAKPPRKRIVHDIESTLSAMTKIPTQIASDEREGIRHLGRTWACVFGQDAAIDAVVDSVKRAERLTPRQNHRRLSVLGRGVGKTSLRRRWLTA